MKLKDKVAIITGAGTMAEADPGGHVKEREG
jgi:hypothetical protein